VRRAHECDACFLDPLSVGVAENLPYMSTLVACLSVGFVVVVLSRSLPSSAEPFCFWAQVLILLVEPCNRAGGRV
jgi:hypothetical protein